LLTACFQNWDHVVRPTAHPVEIGFAKTRLSVLVSLAMAGGAAPQQRVSARATGVIGVAILCSRLLGLVREIVVASLFGASRNLDAFLTAFRAPNMLRDLFAEGALSTAFVTTFSKKIQTEGDTSAWGLANKIATLTAIFMSIVVLLVSLAALVMGMLNAKHVFGMPALASSFFNIGSIVGGVSIGYWMDPTFGTRALVGLAIGTLIGGFLQLAVQIPSLLKVGFKFRPDFNWRDEGVKKVLQLMGPAIIAASAVQVNVLINSIFASYLEDGAVSWLNIAFRLMQLPLGIFGVAVATVTLPLVSRSAAAGNMPEFRGALAHALRLVLLLTIPSAIGLIILAEPIISLIYEHGRFTAASTLQTAGALRFYAAGLVGYAAIKVLAPAFYAIDKRYLPMIVSFLSIAENFTLNWIFTRYLGWGHRGLAMSTCLVALTDFVLLYFMMRRYVGALETGTLFKTLGKLFVAGAGLAAVCWAAVEFYLGSGSHLGNLQKLFGVLTTVGVGATVFFVTAYLLKVAELRDVVTLARRKLRR
jgi:putative peptidoglycan lipid II flippase